DYTNKNIISYAWSKGFTESLLPHEMAHLIFRDFIGFKGEVPLWLDEGVAQWEEELKREKVKAAVRRLYNNNMLLYLEDMMQIDSRRLKKAEGIKVAQGAEGPVDPASLSEESLVRTYYIQAASLVGFLIEKYGSESFIYFCRQLRDGKDMDEALRFAYPNQAPDLETLEKKWRKSLLE
ncbi:MAG: hypothetical protein JW788_03980, partial [Candidatus Omnitrophica bacterium]|nr:hypothetical protein [Candidatus Omnitrophota bacterium]